MSPHTLRTLGTVGPARIQAAAPRFKQLALAGIAGAALFAASLPAAAQDGASPRAIPEGFVLPGPAPTNAPNVNPDGTLPAEGTAEAADGADAAPPAATSGAETTRPPSSVGGSAVAVPSTVVGPASRAANPMAFASRPEEGTTNWPCVQRKTASIQPAQVWAGPPLDAGTDVARDAEMRRLVDQVVIRRVSSEEAQRMVRDFVEAIPEERREAVAAALFSDILDRLNTERDQVIAGIERYGAKQKALASALRERGRSLNALQRAGTDLEAINETRESLVWDTRIFDERRRSLTYVCEVPTLIEQRAFALGRELSRGL